MSFDSLHFGFFFALIFVGCHALRSRVAPRNAFLLISSYYFYGCWDWRFLSLILLSTLVDYLCGRGLNVPKEDIGKAPIIDRRRKLLLLTSMVTNLGLLGVFKYFNFFADSLLRVLAPYGIEPNLVTTQIVLPVGISFYTFQTMSYTIDLYRGRIATERNLLNFALFVAFFPQLVAGPIERAKHLLPQFAAHTNVTYAQLGSGAYLILWGLFKKVVLADNAGDFADTIFFAQEQDSGLYAVLGIYAFALQIYCDFSGYSDIARGTARLLGIDLMLNFNLPYFATNPSDFWRRWHISLSTWLRDYLYIPLGGNRHAPSRTYANLMTTMVLGGLWHGASWIFVLWGAYHGVLLAAHRLLKPTLARLRPQAATLAGRAWHMLSILCFLQLTMVGWLIFRAESVAQVGDFLHAILTRFPGPHPPWMTFETLAGLGMGMLTLACVQFVQYYSRDLNVVFRFPVVMRGFVYAALTLGIMFFGSLNGGAFIYFQF